MTPKADAIDEIIYRLHRLEARIDAIEGPSPEKHTPLVTSFFVPSRTHEQAAYRVTLADGHPVACTCSNFHYRGNACKHMQEEIHTIRGEQS